MNDLTKPISQPSQNALPERWIDALFLKLATIYGKLWLDQWQGVPIDSVKTTWAEHLRHATGPQIKAALEYVAGNVKYPPTLPEFASICRDFRQHDPGFVKLTGPRQPMPDDFRQKLATFKTKAAIPDAVP